MHRIGEDVAERLDIIPAQFKVIVTRRPKYGCRACESAVVQAAAPARLIEGGPRAMGAQNIGPVRLCQTATEALVAHVLVGKYADHLPLYRQSQIYARQGIELDRSTLADWVGRAAAELQPVHERLFEHLKRSLKLFMDETRAPVLDPGRRRTKTGYLWAIARDDRPWGGTDPPAVAYLYAPGRGAEHAAPAARGVQWRSPGRRLRRLQRARRSRPRRRSGDARLLLEPRPAPLLRDRPGRQRPDRRRGSGAHRRLFGIERTIRGQAPEQRRSVRLDQTKPLIDELHAWLEAKLAQVSGGVRIAQAIRYALKHWAGLTVFLDDGRVEIDSNAVERSIRPIALNRKNALFAGSDQGGVHWAVIASLVETCKLNAVDPQAWLAGTLTRLVNRRPATRSISSCPGPTPRPTKWPDNIAYVQPVWRPGALPPAARQCPQRRRLAPGAGANNRPLPGPGHRPLLPGLCPVRQARNLRAAGGRRHSLHHPLAGQPGVAA